MLVAAHALAAGTALTSTDVRLVRWPVDVVPDGTLTDPASAVDASTAVPLAAGTPVLPGLLVDDGVRGPPGTVVATVRFADPAVARLLTPGMRVDVLAATAEGGPGGVVATRALVLPVAHGDRHGRGRTRPRRLRRRLGARAPRRDPGRGTRAGRSGRLRVAVRGRRAMIDRPETPRRGAGASTIQPEGAT